MCLILFAYHSHPSYPLVLIANRDEFYQRKTLDAKFWPESPQLLAGKDLEKNGTWLGITRTGRFAAVTNYREAFNRKLNYRSRGELTKNFLLSNHSPEKYLNELVNTADQFDGFGLLVGDMTSLYFFSNKTKQQQKLTPGIYGLSNHLLDTPWPKLVTGKRELEKCLTDTIEVDSLMSILSNEDKAADDELPHTGVGYDIEHLLSSRFIQSSNYGTRSSTVLLLHQDGQAEFVEQTFGNNGIKKSKNVYNFKLVNAN